MEIENIIKEYKQACKGLIDAKKYANYAITYHSTAIEGSTLTLSQVTDLLEYGKTVSRKAFWEHQMVADNYAALQFIIEHSKKKTPISLNFISEISSLVMRSTGQVVNAPLGTFDVSKGEYRKCSVRAGKRTFPDCKKVPTLVKELCTKLNNGLATAKTIEERLNLSFMAQFELVSIHPFGDGNGRVSRLLMNYIQLYFGLPAGIIFKTSKQTYIDKMEKARETDDIKPYLSFMFAQYKKFLQAEIKDFSK